MIIDICAALFAYLLGSLSTAVIACKLSGLPDPRTQGSGNPGATNVLRFGGKGLAVVVLIGDLVKGLIPVLVALLLSLPPVTVGVVGLLAFIGHIFPVFFGFRGGKGVATALGVILGLSWISGLAILGIWILVALIFKYSSLAAICAALAAPVVVWLTAPEYAAVVLVMSLALLWRHRSNIRNLMGGVEPKVGKR
ncbi:MAG: glycerol-3-phosphate 1-O-acyltransferase PlsY [Gammaproteobacteria bacterium]|nr:glycerol-3-phosphate 1-O-acyltransferase PlsY [Gammaproteobacteria bacterium]